MPKSKTYGYDHTTHHLLSLKIPPPSLVRLRSLLFLPENNDIREYAQQGTTFEDCVGRIAAFLSIAMDGLYDGEEVCEVLANAISARYAERSAGVLGAGVNAKPHLSDTRLVDAEMVEREDTITVEQIEKMKE